MIKYGIFQYYIKNYNYYNYYLKKLEKNLEYL